MQSCGALGYGAAAVVFAIVLPAYGWRAVFFVGIIPALFTLRIRRSVEEPELWLRTRTIAPVAPVAPAAPTTPVTPITPTSHLRGLWWFGYVTFGFVSDRFGRKPTYIVYLLAASR